MFSTIYKRRILIITISFVAVFFSLYKLTESPPVWYDEGFYIQSAANLAQYGSTGLTLEPGVLTHVSDITVGYPLIYPLAGWFRLFGVGVLQARSLMAIFILGLLTAAYFLAKKLFGRDHAIAALALLATLPTLYGNGKSVLGEIPGMLFLVLFLLLFHIAGQDEKKKLLFLSLSGLFAGLSIATKPTFILLVPVLLACLFIDWRRKRAGIKEIMACLLCAIIPVIVWAALQFTGSDSLSGIASFYANPYRIENIFLVVLKNLKPLFTDLGPLYLTISMLIWTASIWLRKRKDAIVSAAEIGGFIFAVLIIAAFLRTEGWYRYLVEAQIMAVIFLPGALSDVSESIANRFPAYIVWKRGIVIAIVIALSLIGIYQIMFDSWVASAYKSRETEFWQSYFKEISPLNIYYFYDTPEIALFDKNRNYYQFMTVSNGTIGMVGLPEIEKGTVKIDKVVLKSYVYNTRKTTVFRNYEVESSHGTYSVIEKKI